MGGDYIPSTFVPAPTQTWDRLHPVIDKNGWYRFVALTRTGTANLFMRDGNERRVVLIDDGLIEVFQTLKAQGEEAAIICDRLFESCYIAPWTDTQPFLDYSMTVDDEY